MARNETWAYSCHSKRLGFTTTASQSPCAGATTPTRRIERTQTRPKQGSRRSLWAWARARNRQALAALDAAADEQAGEPGHVRDVETHAL